MTTTPQTDPDTPPLISSGLPGLDDLLGGGLTTGRAYQVRGQPGTGKTILGWHFLTAADDDIALMITFDEPAEQLRTEAAKLGLDPSAVETLDLSPTSNEFADQTSYDVFVGPDTNQRPVPEAIAETVEDTRPDRIVVDSMLLFRYLSADAAQRRKQTLAFLRYLKEQDATVLLLSERLSSHSEDDLHFLCDGIIELDRSDDGRSIRVLKQRGRGFRSGRHSLSIGDQGLTVYPRLRPAEDTTPVEEEVMSSGVPEIDQLLGGGFDRGSVTMISGPSGVGKTTLGLQLVKETAGQGERSVIFSFEEERKTLVKRSTQINIPVAAMIEQGTVSVQQFRPWSFDIGQFDDQVRREVEDHDTSMVMIDSLNSFWKCGDQKRLEEQIHRVCKYLIGKGVTVLLINEVGDITGNFRVTEVGLSHLADNLIFLRYLEMRGELRKAIGVLKRRTGNFENSLREFQITQYGLKVGKPLTQLRGVLTGTPEWGNAPDGAAASTAEDPPFADA